MFACCLPIGIQDILVEITGYGIYNKRFWDIETGINRIQDMWAKRYSDFPKWDLENLKLRKNMKVSKITRPSIVRTINQ